MKWNIKDLSVVVLAGNPLSELVKRGEQNKSNDPRNQLALTSIYSPWKKELSNVEFNHIDLCERLSIHVFILCIGFLWSGTDLHLSGMQSQLVFYIIDCSSP